MLVQHILPCVIMHVPFLTPLRIPVHYPLVGSERHDISTQRQSNESSDLTLWEDSRYHSVCDVDTSSILDGRCRWSGGGCL